jgi:membrane fusion protein, adhesin transport system
MLSKLLDRLMDGADRREEHDDSDFKGDAEWAMGQTNIRSARLGVWVTFITVMVLLIWAGVSEIDEVTKGDGKVIPSRQVQIIQSLDGGIISEMLVREGELVEEDQLLARMDSTRFESSLKENRAQYLGIKAQAARLQALADGKPFVPPKEVLAESPEIIAQEESLYRSRLEEMNASIGVFRQQLAQRNQELNEVISRRDLAGQVYELTKKELDATRPLANTGAVSYVELLRLERDLTRYKSERDAAALQIPRIQASIGEAQRKVQEVELTTRNQSSKELSDLNVKLAALTGGAVGLEDKVKQAELRSPVHGTVKRIFVNTVGGVVQPGKEVMEIVPIDDVLLLEAKILPKDIAFLSPGQRALVKFTAYDFSIYGGLEARLEHIAADSITDEKGNAFYVIRVRTLKNGLGDEKSMPIIPGMIAEVDILTGKKTILSYILKPVLKAKANALTER